MVNDFIFELGCEELPSKAVLPLAEEFGKHLLSSLTKNQLSYGEVKIFATPRRLAIVIKDLQAEQASQNTIRRGPAVAAAYDKEKKPTTALLGFAKSCGVDIDALSTIHTDKGDWIVYETQDFGKKTTELLPNLIKQSLAALPIAKPMRWGNGIIEFVRPVHWAVMLYGNDLIEDEILGVKTTRQSKGHRFHHAEEITISSAQSYEAQLKKAFVIADFAARREIIKKQIEELAIKYQAAAVMPNELLDEVTSIVEWPQALIAHFEELFLEVPSEALIASMQTHQKSFALKDKQGKLVPYFITVSNINSLDPSQVISGNEKVMRARLSDAAFFFKQDKKNPLNQHIVATKYIVFQEKLGSLYDKMERIHKLMVYLSPLLNFSLDEAKRVASLSKCDLLTGMVSEFPELQGLMGYYYALNDGENLEVAQALNEQYMPRFAADNLPESVLGKALSLADRIDTLVGIFAIGSKPTGVKDPFKLRRHALAVVRLLISIPVTLNLSELIQQAITNFEDSLSIKDDLILELKTFILERLPAYYQSQGVNGDIVQAVRARQDEWLYDFDYRVQALKNFITRPEAISLSAACKRVSNLLSHTNQENLDPVKEELIEEGPEKALYMHIISLSKEVGSLYASADYHLLLKKLANIKEPVDTFFDRVMVMVDNKAIKENRLAILFHLQYLLQGVADISLLHP